jgi:hypothetical protein
MPLRTTKPALASLTIISSHHEAARSMIDELKPIQMPETLAELLKEINRKIAEATAIPSHLLSAGPRLSEPSDA